MIKNLQLIIACHFVLGVFAQGPIRNYEEKCDKNLPNLSVGDVFLNDENYMKFKKKHKVFILGASDSKCESGSCCHSETVLKSLQKQFSEH
jgi:hypothetical protein